jgi:hypothetical protein
MDTICLLELKLTLPVSTVSKLIRRRPHMPQISVTADGPPDSSGRAVMFTERVTARDFESRHFQTQLVERLGWAVGDAQLIEEEADEGICADPHDAGDTRARDGVQRRSTSVLTTAS